MSVRLKTGSACKNCGHTTVDRFSTAGEVSCTRCGVVLEENPIVSEVQFGESSSGAAMVQGAMVGADQARANYGNGRQNALESREQTLVNGKRKIRRIAAALRIPEYISDAAGEWFKLALTQNFVQGRRSQNVLAACLYVACRKEKTHHMLIDFSSRLQISVYSLGATFLKMVKALSIMNLPLADPSIFIQHFAEKLDFKEMCTKVVRDAVKLAQRMSNDWIHEGRRPAGVAGACVLLAARMNNFRRTHSEIVAVAHVGEVTLQRRLNEFKNTKSGELSVAQFRNSEGTEEANPPSFQRNRSLETKIQQQLKEKQSDFEDIERVLNETKLGREKRSASQGQKRTLEEEDNDSQNEEEAIEAPRKRRLRTRERVDVDDEAEIGEDGDDADEVERGEDEADEDVEPSIIEDTESSTADSNQRPRAVAAREEKRRLLNLMLVDCDLSIEEINQELSKILNRKQKDLKNSMYVNPSEGVDEFTEKFDLDKPRNLVKNLPKTQEILSKISSEIELTELDDDIETLSSTLTEEERKVKERLWTGLNHDFLVAQEKKRLKHEADILAGNTSGSARKRKPRNSTSNVNDIAMDDAFNSIGVDAITGEPLSAGESARREFIKKPFSKKINYNTLDDLFEKGL